MLQTNMLQPERGRTPLVSVPQTDQAQEGGIGELVNFVIAFLRRQYVVIIATTVLTMLACLAYLRIAQPTYTAQVQVLLGAPRAQFVQQQSLLAEPNVDLAQIETQLQLVKSRAIAVAVINQLKLADDPDLDGSGTLLAALQRWIRAPQVSEPKQAQSDVRGQPPEIVIATFLDRLNARRISVSNVIEITFDSRNAARAARVANAVANAYIADLQNAKIEANRVGTGWLQERLRELGEQALAAERAVSAYKSENNIVSSGGRPIDDQQIGEMNNKLAAARTQTSEASAKLNRYETILRTNPGPASTSALDAATVDALNSQIITNLRQKYLDLSRRESEWSVRFGREHSAVNDLRNQMRDLRNSILEELKRLAEIARSEFEVAKLRQQEIEKQLRETVSQSHSTNSAELTIRGLESRAKSLRTLYDTFLQRYMGSVQQETFPISETRVIYPASAEQTTSKPKTKLVVAMGIFGGLALGIALGLLREIMDRVFRTSAQIESALELPCLSLVPLVRTSKLAKSAIESRHPNDDLHQRVISSSPAIHRAVVGMPLSRFAEAIRAIKLAIDLNPGKSSNQVIGITSALPDEGKSSVAAALAQLIGHSGKRAIIVDCDLRNPTLSASLAPNAPAGIMEVMNGTRSIEETVWQDPNTNLVFLPVARRERLLHTSEILSAEGIRKLFDRLRTRYDYIIVDLPPLTPLVDVRATTPLIDCFILVVEWGRTKIDVVQHALHTAPNIHECIIGAVLNKTDIRAMARYDAHRSAYYRNSHYTRYGFTDHG